MKTLVRIRKTYRSPGPDEEGLEKTALLHRGIVLKNLKKKKDNNIRMCSNLPHLLQDLELHVKIGILL